MGGQLPRRVSGGICGVAAGHAKGERQADEVEVKRFKGVRKKRETAAGKRVGRRKMREKGNWVPPSVM